MKVAAIIHNDVWQQVIENDMLKYETGDTVTTYWRDPVWEEGVAADEETGAETPYRRFLHNDEPVEVTKDERKGGFIEIGTIGNWHIVFLASKGANLQAINQLSANKVLGLATIRTDGEGNVTGWDAVLDEGDRAKISTWMENNGYGAIPDQATARQAVRRVWRVINAELDENSFDIGE